MNMIGMVLAIPFMATLFSDVVNGTSGEAKTPALEWKDAISLLALVVSIFAFAISRSQYILATRTYRMNGIITVWKEANSGDVKDGMRVAEQIIINAGPIDQNADRLDRDVSDKVNEILLGMAGNPETYRDYAKLFTWIEFFANVVYMGNTGAIRRADMIGIFRNDLVTLKRYFRAHIKSLSKEEDPKDKFAILVNSLQKQGDL
jgi:hypothetical protein